MEGHFAVGSKNESSPNVENHVSLSENMEIEKLLKSYRDDISFIENVGFYNEDILFHADFAGGKIRFLEDKISYTLSDWTKDTEKHFVFNQVFLNANKNSHPFGKKCKDEYINYVGIGESAIIYDEMWFESLYDGVDLRYYSRGDGVLEHDFIVVPGAHPSTISWSYEGIDGLNISNEGHLEIETPFGTIQQQSPYAYQVKDGKEVEWITY